MFFVHLILLLKTHFLYCRKEATTDKCNFLLRQEKDDQKVALEDKDLEVIGLPIIKYGDSTVIMQHAQTSLWVSYKVNLILKIISTANKLIKLLLK